MFGLEIGGLEAGGWLLFLFGFIGQLDVNLMAKNVEKHTVLLIGPNLTLPPNMGLCANPCRKTTFGPLVSFHVGWWEGILQIPSRGPGYPRPTSCLALSGRAPDWSVVKTRGGEQD